MDNGALLPELVTRNQQLLAQLKITVEHLGLKPMLDPLLTEFVMIPMPLELPPEIVWQMVPGPQLCKLIVNTLNAQQ